jgi:serine/threonine protein kinase
MNPGDRYGGYHIIRPLGRGAMGEVFLATNEETGQQIALKIVYKGPDPEDEEILKAERLGAELQKQVAAIDPRVCAVKRYGEINGDLFIEMEHIDGEDLSTILSRNPLAPVDAAHIAAELCEMLQHLQAFITTIDDKQFEGVIHGDLKPKNIRLNALGQVKVLDFGIAKALSHTRKYTMNVFASTAYCSPERLETQSIDSRSDLWSVGVLLYQMIAARLPFDAPSKEALERRIRSTSPPDILPPGCPADLQRIIFKMLARDAAHRYQSAAELSEDLEHFGKGEPVNAEAFDTDTTTRTTDLSSPAAETGGDDRTIRTTAPAIEIPSTRWNWSRKQVAVGCLGLMGLAGASALGFGVYQLNVWNRAGQLRTDLETERVTNLDDAWVRYQKLAGSSHFPTMLWGAQSALKKRLVAAADETILEYRNNDAPMVFEPQWTQARNLLARALQVDSGDNSVKGRLRLCEAHLDRIQAAALKGFARQKRINFALAKFQESADLLRRSPDPYLGIARLYVYDLNDVEKAEEALNKAADYGHPEGKRERAQLGDGYRRRADRIWRDSRALRQMPDQERDYLDHAKQDYEHAQNLYQQAGLFGDSARNEIQAMQGEQRVEQRLSELQRGWRRE